MPLAYDDRQLEQYLLGLLPEEDADQLDELSIADDEMAWRLRAAENDLVDAYVSGTLGAETSERFESFYLASPRRRERVELARTFLHAIDQPALAATPQKLRDAAPVPAPSPADHGWPMWSLAAAAVVILASGALLLTQEMRVRSGRADAQQQTAALERRTQELERQLEGQRAANAEATRELERLRASLATAQRQTPDRPGGAASLLTALILLPQTRAAGPVATLSIPDGVDHVTFGLRLETNDFPLYQVALKDPATNQVLWRSAPIAAASTAGTATVSVVVPTNLLKPQHYALELSGRRPAETEIVGSYAVEVVRR